MVNLKKLFHEYRSFLVVIAILALAIFWANYEVNGYGTSSPSKFMYQLGCDASVGWVIGWMGSVTQVACYNNFCLTDNESVNP